MISRQIIQGVFLIRASANGVRDCLNIVCDFLVNIAGNVQDLGIFHADLITVVGVDLGRQSALRS